MNSYTIPNTTSIITQGKEVLRLTQDGRIFWLDREVVGDEMFKEAMIDLNRQLKELLKQNHV